MERTKDRGFKHKLTEAQRKEIEQRYFSEGISQDKLAEEYGVSQPTICFIVSPLTRKKRNEANLRYYYERKERRNESTVL